MIKFSCPTGQGTYHLPHHTSEAQPPFLYSFCRCHIISVLPIFLQHLHQALLYFSPLQHGTSSLSNRNNVRRQRAFVRNKMICSWRASASLHCPLVFRNSLCTFRGTCWLNSRNLQHRFWGLAALRGPAPTMGPLSPLTTSGWSVGRMGGTSRSPLREGGCCTWHNPHRWSAGLSHPDRARPTWRGSSPAEIMSRGIMWSLLTD